MTHAEREHAMVLEALGLGPDPIDRAKARMKRRDEKRSPIPSQSDGNNPRIDRKSTARPYRRADTNNRTQKPAGPKTPLFSVTQFGILREAQKIRGIPDYRPDGWMTILEWATRIEEEHAR